MKSSPAELKPRFSGRQSQRFLIFAFVVVTGLSQSACLKRPDFMIRVEPAAVPLMESSRTEVAAKVSELEQGLAASSYKGSRERDARTELEALRLRLARGDFQVGDQMLIRVRRGSDERADSAIVTPELTISFAALPDLSVAGVLRSEVQPRLQTHVDRYLVDFTVRVNLLTRLQIMGGVGRAGFYHIAPDRPVSELIMLTGGVSPVTDLDNVNVRRNGRLIVKPSMWKDALKSGTTVAQLGLQAGDVIEFGTKSPRRDAFQIVRIFAFASTALFGIIRLLQFIYAEPQ